MKVLITLIVLNTGIAQAIDNLLTVQTIPTSNICFRHEIKQSPKIEVIGFGAKGVTCKQEVKLGQALPTGTLMNLVIVFDLDKSNVRSSNHAIRFSTQFMSQVREVHDIETDIDGALHIRFSQFTGCGSDCYYEQNVTSFMLKGSLYQSRLSNVSALIDISTRYIRTSETNFY